MSSLATTVLMIVATLFWGINFPLAHLVVAEIHPLEAVTARFVLSAFAMVIMAGVQRQSIPVIRHGWVLGTLAWVGVVAFNLLFFMAMQSTSAVNGALIMGTNPLVTAILAWVILRERPNFRHVIAMPFAFLGVAVVVGTGGGTLSLSLGDVLMMGANLSWASYNVLARRWMPAGSGIANTAAIMIFCVLGIALADLALAPPMVMPGLAVGAELTVIALAGTVLAYLCYNHGIAKLGAGRAALFMNLVPVWAMLASVALGKVPSLIQVLGGCVVIASVLYATLPRRVDAVIKV